MQRFTFQPENSIIQTRPVHHRLGFTMIELLIVVAIIGLLMSIIGVATLSMIGTAKVAATKATIVKVQGLLQQRVDAATRKDPDPALVTTLSFTFGKKPGESLARKISFRRAFPQTWSEVPTPVLASLPAGSPAIPGPATTPERRAIESAEVLHFMLTKANVLGYPPVADGEFNTSEVADTDINPMTGNAAPNGWPEFVDAWGKPLRFYRWPTRLIRGGPWSMMPVNPSQIAKQLIPSLPTSASELSRDPDDKYGFLKVGVLIDPADVTYYEQGTAPMGNKWFARGAFNTPETFSLPLIVSGGPDLTTGLFEPSDLINLGYWAAVDPMANPNATFDDISNYNIRSGGR